jgi:hypothetical protein
MHSSIPLGCLNIITSDKQLIVFDPEKSNYDHTIFEPCWHFTGGDNTFWADYPYDKMVDVIKVLYGEKILVKGVAEDRETIEIVKYHCPTYKPESELKTQELPVYANSQKEIRDYSDDKKQKKNHNAYLRFVKEIEDEWDYNQEMQDWYDNMSKGSEVPRPIKKTSNNDYDDSHIRVVKSDYPYEEEDFYVE